MTRNNQDFFISFVDGLGQKSQEILRWQMQKQFFADEYIKRQEREQLKKEIIAEVLQEIGLTIDVEKVIQKIEEIKNALDRLEK